MLRWRMRTMARTVNACAFTHARAFIQRTRIHPTHAHSTPRNNQNAHQHYQRATTRNNKYKTLATCAQHPANMASHKVVVIDNGGGTTKIGLAGPKKSPMIIPNQIAKPKGERRNYIGDQIEQCPNTSSLYYRRPIDKGFVINWDTQREIWDHAFSKGSIKPAEHDLLLTEPLFNPDSLKKMMYEFIFEEYQFRSLCCCSAPYLALLGYINENTPSSSSFAQSVAHCVIDTGYSFSHIVPFYDQQKVNYSIKRINIGGKSLTNYLKELASYRHWNMMEETHIINVIKEKVCYTSLNFDRDLNICNSRGSANTIQQLYVLPDFTNSNTGYVKGSDEDPFKNKTRDTDKIQAKDTKIETPEKPTKGGTLEEQILPMNNERFTVPEALFNPNNVGVYQAGIPEAVTQAINATMEDLHEPLYANILLTGGNVLFPNFKERLVSDLRSMVPENYNVNVVTPRNVITCAWEGGSIFAQSDTFSKYQVTKEDYEEYGTNICKRKFYN